MSCVSHAFPAVGPTRLPFSCAGPAIRYCPSGSFASICLIGVSAFSGSTVSKNSSLRPRLPSAPPGERQHLAGGSAYIEAPPALAVDEPLEAGVPVGRVVLMLSLASLSGTGARESVADRAGASSAECEPTPSDSAAAVRGMRGRRASSEHLRAVRRSLPAATLRRPAEAGMRRRPGETRKRGSDRYALRSCPRRPEPCEGRGGRCRPGRSARLT